MLSSTCNASTEIQNRQNKLNKVQNLNPKNRSGNIQNPNTLWCWTTDLGRRWTLDFERSKRNNTKNNLQLLIGQLSWRSLWFLHVSWMGAHMVILGALQKMASSSFLLAQRIPHLQSLPLERDRYFPATQKPPWMAFRSWSGGFKIRGSGLDSIYSGFRYTYQYIIYAFSFR